LKAVGLTFLITLGIVWLPWVAWFAIDTYLLRHYDPKFGRDGGFLFGVFLRGATGLVSATVASVTHGVEMALRSSLTWRSRRHVAVLGGIILSALSPIVPVLYIPGLPPGFIELVLPWALVSLFCVLILVSGARLCHFWGGLSRPTSA
jgi:hypothetical protein